MMHANKLKAVSIVFLLVLSVLVIVSLCDAQTHGPKWARKVPKKPADLLDRLERERAASRLPADFFSTIGDAASPITVYPGGVAFESLQDAFDYCSPDQTGGGSGATRDYVVVIQAGTTWTGNYTLPNIGIRVIGMGGKFGATIQGSPGNSQPVITFAPGAGPSKTHAWLSGLWIMASDGPAIEYVGASSYSSLWLDGCMLDVEGAHSGIEMSGLGYGPDMRMSLSLDYTGVETDGDGIVIDVGEFTEGYFLNGHTGVSGTAVDIRCAAPLDNDFYFLNWYLFATQAGFRASNASYFWLNNCTVSTDGIALEATGVGHANIDRTETHSGQTHSIVVDATDLQLDYSHVTAGSTSANCLRALNNSTVNCSYNKFSGSTFANAYLIDGTSSKTGWIYNHHKYTALP